MGEGDIEGMPRCSCGGGLKVTTKRIYAGGRDRGNSVVLFEWEGSRAGQGSRDGAALGLLLSYLREKKRNVSRCFFCEMNWGISSVGSFPPSCKLIGWRKD